MGMDREKDRSATEWTPKNKGSVKPAGVLHVCLLGWWRQVVVTVRLAFPCLGWGFYFISKKKKIFCLLYGSKEKSDIAFNNNSHNNNSLAT